MSSPELVEAQLERLLTGDRAAREEAALLLRGWRIAAPRLAPVLAHPHVSRQVKAIEILRAIRTRDAVELLVPYLASPNELLATKATSALGRIGAVASDRLDIELDRAASPSHRLNVLDVLARLGRPRGLEALLALADSWDHAERRRALELLRHYPEDMVAEPIVRALGDPDPGIRGIAISVAGKRRHWSWLPPLVAIWLDDPRAPTEALFAIGKYGPAALDALIARARDATPELRARIARGIEWALIHHAWSWDLWTRPEPAVRDACLSYFGMGYARRLEGARRRVALAEHLADPDPMRRRLCVFAYRQLHEADRDAARAGLVALAQDADESVRTHAEANLRGLAR